MDVIKGSSVFEPFQAKPVHEMNKQELLNEKGFFAALLNEFAEGTPQFKSTMQKLDDLQDYLDQVKLKELILREADE